jgi:hypothetical protein
VRAGSPHCTNFVWDAAKADAGCYFCLVASDLFLNCEAADAAQRDMFVAGFTKLLLESEGGHGGVRAGVKFGGVEVTQEMVQAFKVCAVHADHAAPARARLLHPLYAYPTAYPTLPPAHHPTCHSAPAPADAVVPSAMI